MQQQDNQEIVPYIQTLDKKLEKYHLEEFDFILPHEHFYQTYPPENEQQKTTQISLKTLQYLKHNPNSSWQNLVLADITETDNELKEIKHEQKIPKILYLECTHKDNLQDIKKIQDLYESNKDKSQIGFGFTYQVDKQNLYKEQEKNLILYSIDNIINQIKYEFSVGNSNELKPAFLGEICLDQVDLDDPIYQNILTSYFRVSNEYSTPLYLNLQNNPENYRKLDLILEKYALQSYSNKVYIVWNPYIQIQNTGVQQQDGSLIFQQQCLQFQNVINLFKKGLYVGFDTLRYWNIREQFAQFIIQLCQSQYNFSDKIFLSSGVFYKTDLIQYGGNGYGDLIDFYSLLKEKGLDNQNQLNIQTENFKKIFFWAKFKVEQEEIKYWTCPMCNKEFDESQVEKFKKFGKEFCSMKCLKKYLK